MNNSKEKREIAIRTIRIYLVKYKKRLLFGGVCLVLADVLLLANPWILKLSIDGLRAGLTRAALSQYAGLFVGITFLSGVFRFLMRRVIIGVSRLIEFDMRGDFFEHLQRLSPSFYNKNRTGDLMALATNDLNAVRTLVGPGVMYTLNTIVVAGFSIAVMLVLSWRLTIAVLMPMAALTIVVYHSVKVIHKLFERVQREFGAINSRAQENLSGIRVVKAYAQEDHETEEFTRISQSYVNHNMKLFKVQSILQPLLFAVAGLGGLSLLGVGGKLVIDESITLGTFVAFSGYLVMLVWPMIALGWVMNILQRGLASMERINVVMGSKPSIVDEPTLIASFAQREPAGQSIEFRNVSFTYRGTPGSDVIKNVSFKVEDGESMAIVGPTGSGKSTLISLILRLHDPTEGEILIGGVPIKALPLSRLRNTVGLVPQDIFLFSDTIRENIAFGVAALEDPVLHIVSQTAAIHNDILAFPKGFESRIGERGINLSGGQKQRVAIARALAKDPRILILDDSLSSVDANTEEKIVESLRSEMRARTAIIVSHRISTVRLADRVMVLDDGELVEEGTHDDLIRRGGIYADMYHKQMLVIDLEKD